MREMMATADTSLAELTDATFALRQIGGHSTEGLDGLKAQIAEADPRLDGLLTRRELEVLQMMAGGARNAEIASELVISESTVKAHVKHIFRKMHSTNRAQAVSRYLRLAGMSHQP
jgi:LuxR family transcriptional regulator, regulator of acetate metabolism